MISCPPPPKLSPTPPSYELTSALKKGILAYRAYFPDQRLSLPRHRVLVPGIVLHIILVSDSRAMVERADGGRRGLRWAIKALTNSQPKHQPFLLQKSLLTFHRLLLLLLLPPLLLHHLIIATHLLSQYVYNQSLF